MSGFHNGGDDDGDDDEVFSTMVTLNLMMMMNVMTFTSSLALRQEYEQRCKKQQIWC